MMIPDAVIITAFSSLFMMLVGVVLYVRRLHGDTLATAQRARLECQAENEQLREIIQALVNGDEPTAKELMDAYHSTATTGIMEAVHPPMPTRCRRRTLLGLLPFLCLALSALLTGCADARQAEREQATCNSAATIYEAALAIERGVPAALPVQAIKTNASAIATANGHPYPSPYPSPSPSAAPAAPTLKAAP